MRVTGERFVPLRMQKQLEVEHMHRYYAAQSVVKNRVVLDAACGTGYGSNILSLFAERVYGIDISEEAIDYAKENYQKDNIEYIQASIESLPFDDGFFDAVVSFETIEHVDEELQNRFLNEIKRVLKKDGMLIMSTPNKRIFTDQAGGALSEWHIKEFYEDEYKQFMERQFQYVKIYNQYMGKSSHLICEESRLLKPLNFDYGKKGKYFITIASNSEIGDETILDSTYYYPDRYVELNDRIQVYFRKQDEAFTEDKCAITEISNNCRDIKNKIILGGETAEYIRLDPLTVSCELVIRKITVKMIDEEEKEIKDFKTNADVTDDRKYVFYSHDPQILIELGGEKKVESVYIEMSILNKELDLYAVIRQKEYDLEMKQADIDQKSDIIKTKDGRIAEQNSLIDNNHLKIENLNREIERLQENTENLQRESTGYHERLERIQNSKAWKLITFFHIYRG